MMHASTRLFCAVAAASLLAVVVVRDWRGYGAAVPVAVGGGQPGPAGLSHTADDDADAEPEVGDRAAVAPASGVGDGVAMSEVSWQWAQDWLAYRWAPLADSRELALVSRPLALMAYVVGTRASSARDWVRSPSSDDADDAAGAEGGPLAARAAAGAAGSGRELGALGAGDGDGAGPALRDILVARPVVGEESSGFGYRRDPFHRGRKRHKGIDFRADRGTPVYAAGAGRVVVARRRGGYGRVVMIDHGLGLETRYAHLRRIAVQEGAFVTANAVIGAVGSTGRTTGPHLHFEVRIDGVAIDPRPVLVPDEPSPRDESVTGDLDVLWQWLL